MIDFNILYKQNVCGKYTCLTGVLLSYGLSKSTTENILFIYNMKTLNYIKINLIPEKKDFNMCMFNMSKVTVLNKSYLPKMIDFMKFFGLHMLS